LTVAVESGQVSFGPIRNGYYLAIRVGEVLGKTWSLRGWVAKEPFGARESTEVRVERAVLLINHKDILHLFPQQPDYVVAIVVLVSMITVVITPVLMIPVIMPEGCSNNRAASITAIFCDS
jgi:hypothetical protein